MLSPADYRAIVTKQRTGLRALLWRGLFRVVSWPYGLAMRWRNRGYDRNPAKTTRVAVPVVSIGNLTLGGTGKTPLVEWLCRWLREQDVRVAIVSRGYGAEDGATNDEARELEEKLPDVPHVQNPDRIAAATLAIEELATQFIVLDDAFQHRRIARDLDIVLIDATEPLGHGYVFPRGTLREPLSGVSRAQALILTRADQVSADERALIHARYQQLASQASWAEAAHQPVSLRDANGVEAPLELLQNAKITAFCGIGNPAGFRHTLTEICGEVIELREFPDHHSYTRDDLDQLGNSAKQQQAELLVCTHKDLVKIGVTSLGGVPLYALRIGLKFLAGEEELLAKLRPLLERIPPDDHVLEFTGS
jgi:tetraacyldisaccharide 4'-kinase